MLPKLTVYPTFILQLTTLSLLFSFTSGAAAILPALTSPSVDVTAEGAALVQSLDNVLTKTKPEDVRSRDYLPITDSKNVKQFITDYFADIPIMAKVAACESRNRHYVAGQILKGKQNTYDRGVMQINILYHGKTAEELKLDLHNIDDNVAYARYLYEKQGVKPWMSSSKCWTKSGKEFELAIK
ncbi:MAG: hypothetical protein Q8O98_01435 [bacterium]|nr:hypothetical protein [bacterium]